ncbi:MAG: PSD1 and planctomycete cytochrome C domain-containing protein [Pirellulales bacterium]
MIRPTAICSAWLLAGLAASGAEPAPPNRPAGDSQAATAAAPRFDADVAPILTAHCQRCHGDDKPKAGLSVTSAGGLARGGESGPAVVPGKIDESLLVDMVVDRTMPPEGEGTLSEQEISVLRRWVADGAAADVPPDAADQAPAISEEARKHWAFRPLAEPEVPRAAAAALARTPLDAFVSARLAQHGRTLAPAAARAALARRLSFDLVGLPPSPTELESFAADQQPDAYQRLVERLLASPHYGERWGRHWLDAAGYSDITGGDNDAGIIKLADGKWKYRDYVVRAYNEDKPYDRFVIEQLAGDELTDWRNAAQFTAADQELLIATGFLRSAADDTDEKELNTPDITNGVLQRTSEVVASCLLGLTVNCAKCHDHKYEPIPQRDYYSLLAAFTPVFNPGRWTPPKQRALADIAPARKAEAERHNADVDRQVGELKSQQTALREACRGRLFDARLAALPEAIRDDVKTALGTAADKRSEVQKYLASKFEASCKVGDDEVAAALDQPAKNQVSELGRRIAELEQTRRSWGTIQAAYEIGPTPVTRLLRRGNYQTPGAPVQPGFLAVLCAPEGGASSSSGGSARTALAALGTTSGRRLALARWVTDWQSPSGALAARVYVNRVWQHLFGRGIVATGENLGVSGSAPVDRELLDWLTAWFINNGCHTKPLIQLIVSSDVYRQRSAREGPAADAAIAPSTATTAPPTGDPDGDWLWHMPLKRLDAEIVRDAILAVSGQLDPSLGGPPLPLETRPDGSVVIQEKQLPSPAAKSRRSIYVLARRNYHLSMLNVFDQPAMATNCPRRDRSAVVLQSLAMLNDDFVVEQAGHFARRVRNAAGSGDWNAQIDLAFRIALARSPSTQESEWSQRLLAEHAAEYSTGELAAEEVELKSLAHLCHMLLGSNEFLYVQ